MGPDDQWTLLFCLSPFFVFRKEHLEKKMNSEHFRLQKYEFCAWIELGRDWTSVSFCLRENLTVEAVEPTCKDLLTDNRTDRVLPSDEPVRASCEPCS